MVKTVRELSQTCQYGFEAQYFQEVKNECMIFIDNLSEFVRLTTQRDELAFLSSNKEYVNITELVQK